MNVPPADFVPTVQAWVDMAREKGLSPRALWEVMHVATHKDIGLSMVDRQAEWWERLKKFAGEGTTLQEMRDAAKGTLHLSCLACMEFLDKRAFYTTEPVSHADKTHNDDPDAVSDYCAKFPSGSLGVALLSVREGDVICVVKGGRTPFILRPLLDPALQAKAGAEGITEDELSNCYTLVSMCYIYGMMQGQTVAEKPAWETIYLL
jgi:hypothetical protein